MNKEDAKQEDSTLGSEGNLEIDPYTGRPYSESQKEPKTS